MSALIEPKEIQLQTERLGEKTYILSKFPCIAGREIVSQYVSSALPKIGEYKTNEAMMFKLMAFVAVPIEGGPPIRLTTPELINAHVDNFETGLKIEGLMMEYNCSFFRDGRISTFLTGFVQNIPQWISKTLTLLSAQSSDQVKPKSTS